MEEALGPKKFDIIVDDASHASRHQIQIFKTLYPRLKRKGTYVIEDVNNPNHVITELAPIIGNATLEKIDLREAAQKRADSILVVITKQSNLLLL